LPVLRGTRRPSHSSLCPITLQEQEASMHSLSSRIATVQNSESTLDLVKVMLRGVLGWVFIYHGSQKLFGWLGGSGVDGTASYFASQGIQPSKLVAVVSGATEFGGGIMLLAGLLTPLAGAALSIDMLVAIVKVNASNGLISEKAAGGYEINLTLLAMAASIAMIGAGRISVDRIIGLARPRGGVQCAGRPARGRPAVGELLEASRELGDDGTLAPSQAA
jgi:putative oxidoreductase